MRAASFTLPKFYRNFALTFFIMAVLLLSFVFYLIWAKVIITVTPAQQEISHGFVIDIKESVVIPSLKAQEFISGKIYELELEGDKNFNATGAKVLTGDVVGEVTIVNNYSKDQALVATTRLASANDPDTVLVRLKKGVTVPAGGQVNVQVYPDDPDQFSTLSPQQFIIPGLWGPLQDKIYAENSTTLGESGMTISVVTQEDLKNAEAELKEQLFSQAMTEINDQLEPQQALWPKLVSAESNEVNYDVEVGEEVAEFLTTMKLKAVVIVFDESQVITLAREKLKSTLSTGKQLITIDPTSLSYAVQKYDLNTKVANVKVDVSGGSILGDESTVLDKSNLIGKTVEEIKSYFSQYPEIESVEVEFSPPWLKKTPRIKDKIEIRIES